MYTKIEEAIHFTMKALKEKRRLKENIDLSFHSISVGMMLMKEKCNEETIITGFLHDIIEDSDYTYENIKEKFGEKIANNVLLLSENKDIIEFKPRKIEFINRISKSKDNIILIELADKLQNLLSDYELYCIEGIKALETRTTTYEMNKWYYLKFLKLFETRLDSNNTLLKRYQEIVNIYFGNRTRK